MTRIVFVQKTCVHIYLGNIVSTFVQLVLIGYPISFVCTYFPCASYCISLKCFDPDPSRVLVFTF